MRDREERGRASCPHCARTHAPRSRGPATTGRRTTPLAGSDALMRRPSRRRPRRRRCRTRPVRSAGCVTARRTRRRSRARTRARRRAVPRRAVPTVPAAAVSCAVAVPRGREHRAPWLPCRASWCGWPSAARRAGRSRSCASSCAGAEARTRTRDRSPAAVGSRDRSRRRNPGPKPRPEPRRSRGRSRGAAIRSSSSQPSSRAIASSEAIVVAKSSGETASATRERMPSTIVAEPLLGGAPLVGQGPGAVAAALRPSRVRRGCAGACPCGRSARRRPGASTSPESAFSSIQSRRSMPSPSNAAANSRVIRPSTVRSQ